MTTSSLDALKAQLDITDDIDDDLLSRLLAAAEASVTADILADPAVSYDSAPADLQLAVLMKGAHFYVNRAAVLVGATATIMPYGYADLIAAHRRWVF